MKKLLLLSIVLLVAGCTFKDERDPLRYKGCVIIGRCKLMNGRELRLKLNNSMRDSMGCDYTWIRVPYWEFERFDLGDTIK